MQNVYQSGNISEELQEIEKMQKVKDSYWTLWSNTCADLYTVICC